ncbi:integral membrane protein [Actinomyces sp. Chiba101]|uniref:EamA family transporter n=1 Tax=Actinomyces TaxID=1654 RepID=UPI000974DFCE|nr:MULTISPECIES: EamA family transporter [Actinomyces]BAW92278.1 integral membrane protein [Actinomyces sp. Chiba101]GAV94783.1 integral membrane protein [Actinomyces denticolens]SUU10137.1 Inner membrane transporter rhtA [Actinomyces denticolens]
MLPYPPRQHGRQSGRIGAALTAVPAPGIFIATAVSTYIGAGFAVGLFGVMPPVTVAWWRVTIGALALLAWRRPWGDRLRGRGYAWTRRALGAAAAFGVATATMNVLFYASISYLPMGTAVSLEFLGPVIVAILTGRGWRPRIAAALAMAGVASISGVGLDISDPAHRAGMLLALAAGLAWACYILLGHRVATSGAGLDALAVGTAAGALFYTPLAAPTASGAFSSAGTAAAVLGVAVLSTVIPYALDQINLGRLNADAFSLLASLMPATSMVVGIIMLRQMPNIGELAGLVLVSLAVALAGRS